MLRRFLHFRENKQMLKHWEAPSGRRTIRKRLDQWLRINALLTPSSLFRTRIVNKEMEERVPQEVCENVRRRARKIDRKENRTDDKIRKREIIWRHPSVIACILQRRRWQRRKQNLRSVYQQDFEGLEAVRKDHLHLQVNHFSVTMKGRDLQKGP